MRYTATTEAPSIVASYYRAVEEEQGSKLRNGKIRERTKVGRRPLGDIGNMQADNVLGNKQQQDGKQKKKEKGSNNSTKSINKKKESGIVNTENEIEVQKEAVRDEWKKVEEVDTVDLKDRYIAVYNVPYINNIMKHLKTQEARYRVTEEVMSGQPDVNERMRCILVDWMVEVHFKFKLQQETLYLAINYLDRFLSSKKISRTKLQLLGTTCLWVASKYEEIYAPEIKDFEFITDKSCTREQLLDMEVVVLNALKFEVCVPTAWRFLERYLKVAEVEPSTCFVACMAQFFLECTLGTVEFCKWKPSQLAAAAVYLAKKACKQSPTWPEGLERHSGYHQVSNIRKPAKELCAVINNLQHSAYQAVRIKYASEKLRGVSKEIVPGEVPSSSTAGRTGGRKNGKK